MLDALAALALAAWAALAVLPPWPWRNRHLLVARAGRAPRLDDVTVLIPARDEAELLPRTLAALARQGEGLRVLLVDDRSGDATAAVARAALPGALRVIPGRPLPAGWSGKVWAQHQGEAALQREFTLLLDADIELGPGVIATLRDKLVREGLALASVMARLRACSAWERMLMPPFVYFFKLVYPFALSNRPGSRVAAAAGGCVLLRTASLRAAGGFAALRDAVIDDCTLAHRVKSSGGRTWIGQSPHVVSLRGYATLSGIRDMVARTAYTQLRYSPALLVGCTAAMLLAFVVPPAALAAGGFAAACGAGALALMMLTLVPTLRLLGVAPAWAATLPLAALAFLAMTWISALRYWRGERTRWRGRRYLRELAQPPVDGAP